MKVVLIDDESLALHYLERQLLHIENVYIEIVAKHTDPFAGKAFILEHDVDVVFMDINLPEINGIELAEQILERKPDIHVVFATAYDHYAISAFELNALDYILKPVRSERLTKTMQRIKKHLGHMSNDTKTTDLPTNKDPVPSQSAEANTTRSHFVQLKLFHQVAIETKPDQFESFRFRTSKAQELFLYLIQNRGKLVRKAFLIDLLWPEYEPDRAFSQLYTAVYHVRKSLGPFSAHFQLANETDGYILTLHHIQIDVDLWEQKIINGPPLSEHSIDHYETYLQLFSGDYMQGFEYWWVESERHRLKQQWVRIALQMAAWHVSKDYKEKAEQLYMEICTRHPYVEEAHLSLMKLYASMNDRLSVRHQFRSLQKLLKEELNEQPSAHVQQWYQNWEETC